MIKVTDHACRRFAERVERCSLDDARLRILAASRAIEAAAAFGCEVVRMGGGARLVLNGLTVVTVYQRGTFPRQCRRTAHIVHGEGEWL
jgi:hypothetical protein